MLLLLDRKGNSTRYNRAAAMGSKQDILIAKRKGTNIGLEIGFKILENKNENIEIGFGGFINLITFNDIVDSSSNTNNLTLDYNYSPFNYVDVNYSRLEMVPAIYSMYSIKRFRFLFVICYKVQIQKFNYLYVSPAETLSNNEDRFHYLKPTSINDWIGLKLKISFVLSNWGNDDEDSIGNVPNSPR